MVRAIRAQTEKSRDEAGLGLGAAPPEIVQEMQERVDLLMKENANMMAQWTTVSRVRERARARQTADQCSDSLG
jgi:hypothetical protein